VLVAVAVAVLLWWRSEGGDGKKLPPGRAGAGGVDGAGASGPGGAGSGGAAGAADAPRPGQITMALTSGAIGKTLYRFDASASRDADGAPLKRFHFDFGDGDSESSADGKVEHGYSYDFDDPKVTMISHRVVVTGWDRHEKAARVEMKVEFSNDVGQELREGRLLIEAEPCTMSFSPESRSWFCTTNVRNTQAEAVRFDEVTLAYLPRPDGSPAGKALEKKLNSPFGMRDLKLLASQPAQPAFPAKLNPDEVQEVTLEVPDRIVEGGYIVAITINVSGVGLKSKMPARATINASLGTKRTWMAESEIKRAGLPPPPAPLDMPGPRLPPGADPSKPPPQPKP
jgi:hypothetical protein